MFASIVKHGNAIVPYQEVARQDFHTEFGARLFGFMSCRDAEFYTYWTVKEFLSEAEKQAEAPIHPAS
jgi:hypothetical protein